MSNSRITREQVDGEYRSVGLFVDNAKTYIQLSTGALLLSVTFSKSITGLQSIDIDERYLWIPWICWLLAILTGATYQYCAAKYLEKLELEIGNLAYRRAKPFALFAPGVRYPYRLYASLMVFFYAGTIAFATSAIAKLLGS